jgi:KUP system potassium uptake protein
MRIHDLGHGCYQITARLGFKDEVALLPLLELCKPMGLDFELLETSYFVSRDVLVATPGMGMALWREKLFATMMRNAGNMAEFLKLPANRVIELGTQIEI